MENYKVTLLIFGILLLLLGLVGKIKAKEIEVGTSSSIVRAITALVGAALIILSFNPEIISNFLENNTKANDQEVEQPKKDEELHKAGQLEKEEAQLKRDEALRKEAQLKREEELRKEAQKPKCSEPWKWDSNKQRCIKELIISGKNYSIKLNKKISSVEGRIDFYLNTQRLPGTDSNGRAMYQSSRGKVQVVIPIMLGNTMVGDMLEVIYSTNEGGICSIQSLNETTGWMKTMRVSYSIQLSDCGKSMDACGVRIDSSRKRVYINTKPLVVVISKNC